MSKAILMSIQPKWCELIANGEKTDEIRKTRPNSMELQPPFKCYIYCTKGTDMLWISNEKERPYNDRISSLCIAKDCGGAYRANGEVIGEFVCDDIARKGLSDLIFDEEKTLRGTCITKDEMLDYLNVKNKNESLEISAIKNFLRPREVYEICEFYKWHISDLKIYDEPKLLNSFKPWNRECAYSDLGLAIPKCEECNACNMKKAPQSWCYVEEISNES